jgi:hypothetical protein
MLMKVLWSRDRVRSYLVEPHQFGVLREDIIELDDQEAFTHYYTITKSQLESMLVGNPRKESIMKRAGKFQNDSMDFGPGMGRLLIGSPVGGYPSSIALPGNSSAPEGGLGSGGRGPSYDYAPKVEVDLIDMIDLYVWDDEDGDYRVVTRAAPDVTIYDRPSNWLGHVKGRPCFIKIQPEINLYDYFWGASFAARLTWLQDWRTDRILQIKTLLNKQVDPPRTLVGGGGIQEEKLASLRSAGGMVSFNSPTAKYEVHAPDLPDDLFKEVAQIDQMFDDQAGLGHVLQGKGEAGVRSRGQADLMARLGSSRPKERAIAVEESAEEAAGLILRLVQDYSDQRFYVQLEGREPLPFIAEQFTRDYEVKVDGHSSSPIFVEDRKHDAVTLFENKAIDRETLLDMFDPPNLQDLKERLKKIEKQEAEAAKLQMAMGQQHGHGGKK